MNKKLFVFLTVLLSLTACVFLEEKPTIVDTTSTPVTVAPTDTPTPTPTLTRIIIRAEDLPSVEELSIERQCSDESKADSWEEFGLSIDGFDADGVLRLSLEKGEVAHLATISSQSSTGFEFCVYSENGREVQAAWGDYSHTTWSGGIRIGDSTEVRVNAFDSAEPGIYSSWLSLQNSSADTVSPPFKVEVEITE